MTAVPNSIHIWTNSFPPVKSDVEHLVTKASAGIVNLSAGGKVNRPNVLLLRLVTPKINADTFKKKKSPD